jgi:2-polyprenyl-6-methoxyphenol hydroxylase-like FAD-dependent oxidoreductase
VLVLVLTDIHGSVTLIGDAAHLATPFAGEGVNLAMKDALTLAREIIAAVAPSVASSMNPNDKLARLAAATRKYEKEMFKYSSKSAEETKRNLDAFFGPGGARAVVQVMMGQSGPPSE